MVSKYVIGIGPCLEHVFSVWRQMHPQHDVHKIEIPLQADYGFNLEQIGALDPTKDEIFVAYDERFGNFKRMELMQLVMQRGFRLPPFISMSALVASDVVLGPNCFIGDGVLIGAGSRIDYNTVLHSGVRIGAGTHLRPSCWCDIGVTIGHNVEIGTHSILRIGASVSHGIKVGRNCELGWPRLYDKDIPSHTIYDTRYDVPIRVYGQ